MDTLPPPGELMFLGELLRKVRERRGLSLERLAQAAGKSADGLRAVEAGDLSVSLRQLGAILAALQPATAAPVRRRSGGSPTPEDLRFEFLRRMLGSADFPREDYLRYLSERLELDVELLTAGPFLEPEHGEALARQPLSEGLKQLRLKHGLTVEELARACGIAPEAVRGLESGQAGLSLRQLGDLMEALSRLQPAQADGPDPEQDLHEARLIEAFRRLDPERRQDFLRRLEQAVGGAADRSLVSPGEGTEDPV
jgi:transcriptional regulator with XRE-family HTH domain